MPWGVVPRRLLARALCLTVKLDDAADRRKNGDRKLRHATGQSTQVIVGADASTDADFLAQDNFTLELRDFKKRFGPACLKQESLKQAQGSC